MKILKSFFKKYWLLLLALVLYYGVPMVLKDTIEQKEGIFSFWDFVEMLILLPPMYLCVEIINVWVKRETMMKLLGKEAGIRGALIAFFLGTFGVGPLYMTFPIMGMMSKKGARKRNLFIFMGAWSTTKITQIAVEFSSLGVKYTILRLTLNIISIYVMAVLLEFVVEKEKDWDIKKL